MGPCGDGVKKNLPIVSIRLQYWIINPYSTQFIFQTSGWGFFTPHPPVSNVLKRLLCFVHRFILVLANCSFRLFGKSVPVTFIWHHKPRKDVGEVSLVFNYCNISSARFAIPSRVIELWTCIYHNSFSDLWQVLFLPPPPPGIPFSCL